MPCSLNVANWIDRVEVINKHLSLLDNESEKLSERETICKMITPKISHKIWKGTTYLLREGDNAKTLKAAKTIFKTFEKAHKDIEVREEPSDKKKPKEPKYTKYYSWIADQRHTHEK